MVEVEVAEHYGVEAAPLYACDAVRIQHLLEGAERKVVPIVADTEVKKDVGPAIGDKEREAGYGIPLEAFGVGLPEGVIV